MPGDGSSAKDSGAAAEMNCDGGAPMMDWPGGEAGELRWRRVKLLGCLERLGKHWSGGSTGSKSSPEKKERRRRCAGEDGSAGLFIG